MNSIDLDVLVVGAGPTGSALAVDLARRGLRVRIIDRNAHSFAGSRAKGVQPRTQEVLFDLGMMDEVCKAGSLYPPLGIHLGPFTIPKRMYVEKPPTADVAFPNTWLIPQFSLDKIIHDRLLQFGVQVEFDSALQSFVQDEDGVTATIESPQGTESISCRFMVGADGGSSTVRQNLEIKFPGKTEEADRMIIVDARVDGLSRKYWHVWPSLGGRFVGACPLPGTELFQWMIRLKPGEECKLDEESLNTRIRRQTRSKKITLRDIRWTSVFRPNIRLAEHYKKGRVFIAGDAAHVHTPAGAQGLNTGIQDSYNLGWKLSQVLNGAPMALLDTYEAERQPVAAAVLGLSTKKYEALGKMDPSSVKRGKDEQQLLITYRSGPLGGKAAGATPTLQVGDRAPDAELIGPHDKPVRLHEIFRGPQFTLLAYGPAAAAALDELPWPGPGAALSRVAIDAGASGTADLCFDDRNGSFEGIYKMPKGTLLLVRPDGYIGMVAESDHVAAFSAALLIFAPQA
jgi:2-polyprenyl-6-methoxyphenol hydroxylase-like FAD-dependent oxidoreductase